MGSSALRSQHGLCAQPWEWLGKQINPAPADMSDGGSAQGTNPETGKQPGVEHPTDGDGGEEGSKDEGSKEDSEE